MRGERSGSLCKWSEPRNLIASDLRQTAINLQVDDILYLVLDWLTKESYPPVQYIPRKDVDMTLLARTDHTTYCPYKGDCAYYSIPLGGVRSTNAVWTYESPYAAVAAIRAYLAFYPGISLSQVANLRSIFPAIRQVIAMRLRSER